MWNGKQKEKRGDQAASTSRQLPSTARITWRPLCGAPAPIRVTSIGSEFWVLLGYGVLAGAASAKLRDPRWSRSVDRTAGLMLLLVAVWIALRA